ncbi:hypothetical protein RIF29_40255 [Crotalaria pallida]|uniref:Uncharacterized protein n=1 Tax=Crotalaria pallida TaxID=3830 RepID=A0AAN9E8A1_CROPI
MGANRKGLSMVAILAGDFGLQERPVADVVATLSWLWPPLPFGNTLPSSSSVLKPLPSLTRLFHSSLALSLSSPLPKLSSKSSYLALWTEVLLIRTWRIRRS